MTPIQKLEPTDDTHSKIKPAPEEYHKHIAYFINLNLKYKLYTQQHTKMISLRGHG
ncbi:hypothetical protein PAUR_b0910 [Pseudoalteromonas aurantia 208]|uniref:Orphan protein n=1 Tax=Pseudoalteromonas aurantia 208 TaxID=1314867 RepID=A0ABR9EIJ9_9GAMM|nr:hypothetical protein [Pseudoalteromonas aurantia 208]